MKLQMPRLPCQVMVIASILLATVAFHDSARAEDVPGIASDEIRIGSFGAFAAQGYLFGRLTMDGIDAVFHQVNADGGINGRKLVLIREDDHCDPDKAVAAILERVELLLEPFLGGFTGVDRAALAARVTPRHRRPPSARSPEAAHAMTHGLPSGFASARRTAVPTTPYR